ncbi:hypothetical protein AGMMS50268_40500 [Spirochaetia bacterium]|nr:hypothetical protein AGMMS50268_40500 [Spirochaetia bacterium]
MKNYKVIFMGMLALALVFGLAGCQNGTQEVNGTVGDYRVGAGPAPTGQTAVGAGLTAGPTNGVGVLVSWKGVEYAQQYIIVAQQNNKTVVINVGGQSTNEFLYVSGGSTVNNTDPDSWNIIIPTYASTAANAMNLNAGSSYRIGIIAKDRYDNLSAIAWTDYATR